MKRVNRLAGNEIELGMEIPTIESRASNILTGKGNYICCHKGSTDKDLCRLCRNQYGHLIRLQHIYSFLLFHVVLLSILDVLYAIICYFI